MMRTTDTVLVAMTALTRNKVRSFLTALGVIIGVGAVIAMLAIGEGAQRRVEAMFSSMGSNLLMIMPGSSSRGGMSMGAASQPSITWDDYEAIRTEVPAASLVSPNLRSNGQAVSEFLNWSTTVYGVAPDFFAIRSWNVRSGSLIEDVHVTNASTVALIGTTAARNLFGEGVDPTGQTVRFRGVPLEIIGLLEEKGQNAMGQDSDDALLIPYTTFARRIQGGLNRYIEGTIFVSADTREEVAIAQAEIQKLLRDRHRLREGQPDDFRLRNMTEMAQAQEASIKTFTTLLAAIAAVSLLVGGIGIMNIMLVSVTERTREIGLRMAVGARPIDILLQFLIEALALSLVGGLIGASIGVFLALQMGKAFEWEVVIDPTVAIVSVGFSALVGIVFGLQPAMKASRLDPIEALRYE